MNAPILPAARPASPASLEGRLRRYAGLGAEKQRLERALVAIKAETEALAALGTCARPALARQRARWAALIEEQAAVTAREQELERWENLGGLYPNEREYVRLRYLNGLPHQFTAMRLGISDRQAGRLRCSALKKLAEAREN